MVILYTAISGPITLDQITRVQSGAADYFEGSFNSRIKVSPHTRVFLTGFMGSGKSAIGPLVARALGYRFVDLDKTIERQEGESIAHIFQRQGEDAFRELETQMLSGIQQQHVVVALGGGAFVSQKNRALVKSLGISVWLDPTLDELMRRLAPKAVRRPLLHGPNGRPLAGSALRRRLDDLCRERAPSYNLADLRLRIERGSSKDETAQALVRVIREYLS